MRLKYFALSLLIICILTYVAVSQQSEPSALNSTSLHTTASSIASSTASLGSIGSHIQQTTNDFFSRSSQSGSSIPSSHSFNRDTSLRSSSEIHLRTSEPRSTPRHMWSFSNTGLTENELASYLQKPPKAIHYYRNGELVSLYPSDTPDTDTDYSFSDSNRYLFVSDLNTIHDMAQQRQAEAEQADKDKTSTQQNSPPDETAREKPLPENAFEVVSFTAGRRDDGSVLVPVNPDIVSALQGPDYSLEPFDWRNDDEMRAHLSRVLSFGHGGELILKVQGQGYLKNKSGFDFALYENAFRTGSGLNVVQEFARVGVSNSPNNEYVWFPCDPLNNILSGCLGAVPTAEGGDQFDLSAVGLDEVRYIKIQDLGVNKNNSSRWPTEGCDLDAVRFFHAYTQE